jgi:hypothetical protein
MLRARLGRLTIGPQVDNLPHKWHFHNMGLKAA